LCRVLIAMLSLTMLVGLAMAADPLEERSKGVRFGYEDSVNGYGDFGSYTEIAAQVPHDDGHRDRFANVYLQKRDHGSGSIERESIIISNESLINQTIPDMIYAFGLIATLDSNSMVYSPQNISLGRGYYATHPLNFNSLLSDKTQIKNYASETSMVQETQYAMAISRNLLAQVEYDHYNDTDETPSKGLARSLMNLDMSVTSGTAHIGMLQGNISTLDSLDPYRSAWYKPNIAIDEDYTGTFNLTTKMNLTLPVSKIVSEDSWLPCCSDGWEDMVNLDKKGFGIDTTGIFDCTCLKGLAKA
jgi:hypothetical protein